MDDYENNFFSLSDLSAGSVTLRAYKRLDTGLMLINEKTFEVIERAFTTNKDLTPKFIVSISGFTDSIPRHVLNKATKVEVNAPFKLKYATLIDYTIKSKSNPYLIYDPVVFPLHSGMFDSNVKEYLLELKPKNPFMILLSDIEVIDIEGNVYRLEPIFFKIITSAPVGSTK